MNRRVLLAVIGGTLAIILLWWFAIYSPKRSATASAKSEREAAEARGRDLEVTVARLKELDRNRPQTEADLRALNAAIPATPDLATFILSANEIASQAGVDFLSIAPSPPAQAAAAGVEAVGALGRAIGATCAHLGVTVDYAPVVDLCMQDGFVGREGRCLGATPD